MDNFTLLGGKLLHFLGNNLVFSDSKLKVAKFGEPSHEVIKILGDQDSALAINNTVYYVSLNNFFDHERCSVVEL
jgi:hypothetical protein